MPEDIILLSTADWDNPFWTNKQHMAVQFAQLGHRVFYIDSLGLRKPSPSRQDIGRIILRIFKALKFPRQVRRNLWVWSPLLLPFHSSSIVSRLNSWLLNLGFQFYRKRLDIKLDILWTYNPLSAQFLNLNEFSKVIYHCVDEIKAQPGMPAAQIENGDQILSKHADLIFVTSPALLQTRKKLNPRTHFFPNVADYDHFSKARDPQTRIPEDLLRIPEPRIGFIGAISGYKIDFDLLGFLSKSRPEWSFVLIGKIGEGEPWTDASCLKNFPNIHLMGPRSYRQLPGYLKGLDVALLPNMLNSYTENMFPMKFFEYIAAGKPVVSVNLLSLKGYKELAIITHSAENFLAGIEDALAGKHPPIEAGLAAARQNTYTQRTRKMLAIIRETQFEQA